MRISLNLQSNLSNSHIRFLNAAVGLIALYISLSVSLYAAIPEGMIESLEMKVDAELSKIVNELVTEKHVCDEFWFEWPLNVSNKNRDMVEQEISDMIRKSAEEEFPSMLRNTFEQEANNKYVFYELGDLVEFDTKKGDRIKGYFREIGKINLLIDNRVVLFDELTDDARAHFDRINRDVKIKEYVRAQMAELKDKRSAYENKIRTELADRIYREAGYVKIGGVWVEKRKYVQDELEKRRNAVSEKLKPMLQTKLYYDNGLVQFNNEWMTREDANKQLKKLEEEQAQKASEPTEIPVNETEKTPIESEQGDDDDDGGGIWD